MGIWRACCRKKFSNPLRVCMSSVEPTGRRKWTKTRPWNQAVCMSCRQPVTQPTRLCQIHQCKLPQNSHRVQHHTMCMLLFQRHGDKVCWTCRRASTARSNSNTWHRLKSTSRISTRRGRRPFLQRLPTMSVSSVKTRVAETMPSASGCANMTRRPRKTMPLKKVTNNTVQNLLHGPLAFRTFRSAWRSGVKLCTRDIMRTLD
mmetsp:Transcript_118106/g.235263  ORF Transcript_118106/g.235263 Transcript_118106/m.235263 type:complete len:203 (+) Transcript_118106:306-914(+)